MSAAAEELARECTHPKVRGSRRALLIAIAKLIPEGETKTAPISIEELMASSGYYDQSVRKARDVLVAIGALRVVGGGRGRAASYELLALPGAGADPSLPLIGVVRSGRRPASSEPPALFDQVVDVQVAAPLPTEAIEGPAKKVGTKYRTWRTNIGEKYRTLRGAWRAIVTKVGTFHRSFVTSVSNIGEKYRTVLKKVGTFHRTSRHAVDVDDARARDVRTHLKEVHTHAPPADEPSPAAPRFVGDGSPQREVAAGTEPLSSRGVGASSVGAVAGNRPCRLTGTVHAWCEGRVHVPTLLHEELLRKHGRLDGERDVDVETKLFAFYAERDAELSPGESIGENEFQFWRRSYAAKVRGTPPRDRRAVPRGEVVGADVWSEILRHVETKVNRHSFCTWWADSVLIEERVGAIDVAMKTPEHNAWVQKHYQRVLEEAIAEVRPGLSVRFVDPPAAAAPRWARSS